MQPPAIDEAARTLWESLQTGHRLADLPPGQKPATWDEVYRIQDALIGLIGPIGAWKVSPVNRGSGRICVPIPLSFVHESPVTLARAAPELEVEIGVRLAADLPDSSREYTPALVSEAIGSLHVAIEVVGSRFIDRKTVDPMVGIADLGNNEGIVVGPPIANWREFEVGRVAMSLADDGKVAGSSNGGWSTAEMLEAIAALATHAARRNGGLRAGQVVITGARIGPLSVKVPSDTDATGAGLAPAQLALVSP